MRGSFENSTGANLGHSIWTLVTGVGVIIALMFALLYLAFSTDIHLRAIQQNILTINEKTRLAFSMREAIRKRSFSLSIITTMNDYFERDAEEQRFYAYAREFAEAQENILQLGIGPDEKAFLDSFHKAAQEGRPFVDQAMKDIVEGLPRNEAEELALRAINIQTRQFSTLNRFVEILNKLAIKQIEQAQKESSQERKLIILVGGLVFLSGIIVAILIVRRERDHIKSIMKEISERKKAEENVLKLNANLEARVEERTTELNKSRDALVEAQRVAAIGSWEWLVPENRIIWSEETFRLFGIDPKQVEPNFEQFLERVHPDFVETVREAVANTLEKNESFDIQYKIIRTDNREIFAHAIGTVETDKDGKPLRMFGTFQDISKQRETEETLRKLYRAVEQSPSSVFITDTDGTIEYVNAKFTEMMGYAESEVIGKTPRILKSDDTPGSIYSDLWATILAGREWRGEISDRRKNGSKFWAYVTIAPVKNDGNVITHFVAMHEDINVRKNAEHTMHKALNEAKIANRSKSELLANMSHELRTPLNAIIGFSSTMQEETFGPLGHPKYKEYLQDIFESSEHLQDLISDILDVSAIEAGKMEFHEERLNVETIVNNSMRLIKDRAREGGIKLVTKIEENLPDLQADDRRVKQILLNLLSNAVKFTQPGGSVTLEAIKEKNNGLNFIIRDTGIGLSQDEFEKAMSQFGQVSRGSFGKHEGTGLGLPLTKGLVELHGGIFEIESQKGKGTTAVVRFPAERTVAS